jgi:hypothetical protein
MCSPANGEHALKLKPQQDISKSLSEVAHVYRKSVVCGTEKKGYKTPKNKSPLDLVLDNSEGFIPLWGPNVTLRWRFDETALLSFSNPELARNRVRYLLGSAIMAWGDAVPVRFTEARDNCDFEISVRANDECNNAGCVLASAFFPNSGQNTVFIYPRLSGETDEEQIETMAHEIGHIFGLRHFFAQIRETEWPSEIYGAHDPFSIMNYGWQSALTPNDRADLKRLYQEVWSKRLTHINGTPIKMLRPYNEFAA